MNFHHLIAMQVSFNMSISAVILKPNDRDERDKRIKLYISLGLYPTKSSDSSVVEITSQLRGEKNKIKHRQRLIREHEDKQNGKHASIQLCTSCVVRSSQTRFVDSQLEDMAENTFGPQQTSPTWQLRVQYGSVPSCTAQDFWTGRMQAGCFPMQAHKWKSEQIASHAALAASCYKAVIEPIPYSRRKTRLFDERSQGRLKKAVGILTCNEDGNCQIPEPLARTKKEREKKRKSTDHRSKTLRKLQKHWGYFWKWDKMGYLESLPCTWHWLTKTFWQMEEDAWKFAVPLLEPGKLAWVIKID